ncbi:hypothetical protein [Modestobacter marinus]|uniref:hypothetical protein n=1 Tax=Modestobacter marinus TaxID=477641 RepID=UPI0021BC1DA4|nr:hypothetical protein [Modestobacter marinus]
MHLRTTVSGRAADRPARTPGRHRRPPAPRLRPKLYLGVAAAGALLVNVVIGAGPDAEAEATAADPVSVAAQLDMTSQGVPADATPDLEPLEQLAASRSARESAQTAAQQEQAAAVQAEAERQQAEAEAAARAAAEVSAAAEVKARAEAEAEEAAEEQGAAPAPSSAAAPTVAAGNAVARITNSTGRVKPQVQAAADAVVSGVAGAGGITLGGTRASAADPEGHPSGLALDYMVLSNETMGDAIVAYHVAHWDELGVDYLIYQQRMLSSPGAAWKAMANRGSATANHMDHVHVNYLG